MNIFKLLSQFVRFRYISVSIRNIRGLITSIFEWFKSTECIALPNDSKLSPVYWSQEPTKHYTIDNFNPMRLDSIEPFVDDDENEDDAPSSVSSSSDGFNQQIRSQQIRKD